MTSTAQRMNAMAQERRERVRRDRRARRLIKQQHALVCGVLFDAKTFISGRNTEGHWRTRLVRRKHPEADGYR